MHVLKTEQEGLKGSGFSHTSNAGEESYRRLPKLGDQISSYGIKRPRCGLRIILGELEAAGSTKRSGHVRRKCHPTKVWLEDPAHRREGSWALLCPPRT